MISNWIVKVLLFFQSANTTICFKFWRAFSINCFQLIVCLCDTLVTYYEVGTWLIAYIDLFNERIIELQILVLLIN